MGDCLALAETAPGPGVHADRCHPLLSKRGNYKWILHPALDLTFSCGGLVWFLFILHFFGFGAGSAAKEVQIMVSLAGLGAVALGESHLFATIHRVYTSRTCRGFAPRSSIAALACVILAILGFFVPQLPAIYLKVYLLFVSQHFLAQAYGLSLLYCAKWGYALSKHEKTALSFLMQSAIWLAVVRQLSLDSWIPVDLLSVKLPVWKLLPEWVALASEGIVWLALSYFGALILRRWALEKRCLPLPAIFMIFSGLAIFMVPSKYSQVLWIYVPAFFHASQYIVISLALHLKERGFPEGINSEQIAYLVSEGPSIRYLCFLLFLGLGFFQLLPVVAAALGFNSIVFAASTFACIHFHHFITDSAIWKMRDPETRRLLLS